MRPTLTGRGVAAVGLLGSTAIVTYLWLLLRFEAAADYAVWSGLLFIPVLVLLNVLLLVRAGRRDPDPRFLSLLLLAFALKILATAARYWMTFGLYDGTADATDYSDQGERLAVEYREGNFGADIGREFIGTGFIRVATGVVYAITGPSIYLAWAFFSLLGFWGLFFVYRGFRVALPEADARRYGLLVFVLPSMLFWPSSLGKEAFITLGIGLFAYGAGLLLSGYRTWAIPMMLGVAITVAVRPHITAALFTGLAVAWFVRRRPTRATELTPLTYVAGAAVLVAGGALVASSAASFLGVDVSVSGIDSAIADAAERTDEGGSSFTPAAVHSPLDLPWAAFTVVFRPMVFEATNAQMLLAAAEGTVLLLLVALSWRLFLTLPGRLRHQPYLIFCIVYALVFVYAFSNFGNFGILTRQRVQVLPFLLVFLALRAPRITASPSPPEEASAAIDREKRART